MEIRSNCLHRSSAVVMISYNMALAAYITILNTNNRINLFVYLN